MVRETRWGTPKHWSADQADNRVHQFNRVTDALEFHTEPRSVPRLEIRRIAHYGPSQWAERTVFEISPLSESFCFSGFSYTPADAGTSVCRLTSPYVVRPPIIVHPARCGPTGKLRLAAGDYRRIRTSAVPSPCTMTAGTTEGKRRVMSAVRCTCTV